jgi:phospholipid transport system substrate-binding protein
MNKSFLGLFFKKEHSQGTRPTMLTRRYLLAASAAVIAMALVGVPPARAASASQASAFINNFALELTQIVNGPEPAAQKKAALGPVIDNNVDVAKIARFCLGRFWSTATPAQQTEYTQIFHQVLLNAISGHMGDYKGVSFTLTTDHPQGADELVGTVINRPNSPAANVQWVVDSSTGSPKIVDVVAEGTSLRLTQRSDYASYLEHHGNDIGALLAALHRQVAAAE